MASNTGNSDPFVGFIGKQVILRHMRLVIERTEVQKGQVHFFARRQSGSGCWLQLHQVLNGLVDDGPQEDIAVS